MSNNQGSHQQKLGHHSAKQTSTEINVINELCDSFERSRLSLAHRLMNFPRHVRRQDTARFLAKYEIFKKVLHIHGSVIECGVFCGGGLMAWNHFSAILEPYNHTRKIIGFDTFSGFPEIAEKDMQHGSSEHLHIGALQVSDNIVEEIQSLIAIHDRNRPLGHIPKVELVAGDACQMIPKYIEDNPHLLVSLLYLDFDLYPPTKATLEYLYPRVVKGGIIAFDELNCSEFPGETIALLETLDLKHAELHRFPFDPYISYLVK